MRLTQNGRFQLSALFESLHVVSFVLDLREWWSCQVALVVMGLVTLEEPDSLQDDYRSVTTNFACKEISN